MSATPTAEGKIVQCIGAVVDIQFPREGMPHVFDALTLVEEGVNAFVEKGLTFEVEQQLGDGVVRTIAMGSTDGLQRGMKVRGTGAPISVPVGPATLGRVMDVLGRSMSAGPSQPTSAAPSMRLRPSLTTCLHPLSSLRRASRLSTSSARSPRAARSGSSAAPV